MLHTLIAEQLPGLCAGCCVIQSTHANTLIIPAALPPESHQPHLLRVHGIHCKLRHRCVRSRRVSSSSKLPATTPPNSYCNPTPPGLWVSRIHSHATHQSYRERSGIISACQSRRRRRQHTARIQQTLFCHLRHMPYLHTYTIPSQSAPPGAPFLRHAA